MFEVFTTQARRIVVMAQEEARVLIHNYVGTEHVLLGLTRQHEGVAVEALAALGINVTALRQEVMKIVAHPHAPDTAPWLIGTGPRPPSGHIRFTPEAKKVLELARREAARLGHDHVGTGHLLLGLVREQDGIAAQVLVQFGADLERVRLQVSRLPADQESAGRLPGPATEDTRIVLLMGNERLIADHPGQPADYVHADGTVWTWHERWHLIGGVRDGDRITGRIHLRAYDRDRPRFSAASTRRTLKAVGARVGIDTAHADLVTKGEIAVYDLRGLWITARIARSTDYLLDFTTEVQVARWLESAGFPAARLAGPTDQPIVADGRVVTFWAQVAEHKHYGTVAELACLLRRLHDLDPPSSLVLPELQPFKGAQTRIGRAELGERDREFLLSRLDELRDRYARLDFVLPPGPIHGNADVNSVLPLMWDGSPVLVDLDCFAAGPREWDLVQTAMYFERFGWHTWQEYQEFAIGYGFDVMSWPGYNVLRNVRELILLTWLALNPWDLPEVQSEVSGRIADLRDGNAD